MGKHEEFCFQYSSKHSIKKPPSLKVQIIHYVLKNYQNLLGCCKFEVFQLVFFQIQKTGSVRNFTLMNKALQTWHIHLVDHRIPYYNCKACRSYAIDGYVQIIVTALFYSSCDNTFKSFVWKFKWLSINWCKKKKKLPWSFKAAQPKSSLV